jgi:hypothetical protein
MFTKNDYYLAYLTMRILHFNAVECGAFEDYAAHYQAVDAVNQMRADISVADQHSVETEVDDIFDGEQSRCVSV